MSAKRLKLNLEGEYNIELHEERMHENVLRLMESLEERKYEHQYQYQISVLDQLFVSKGTFYRLRVTLGKNECFCKEQVGICPHTKTFTGLVLLSANCRARGKGKSSTKNCSAESNSTHHRHGQENFQQQPTLYNKGLQAGCLWSPLVLSRVRSVTF